MVMPWPTARDQNEVFHWDCESTSLAGCPAVADPGLLSGAGARALLKVLYLGLWLRLNITWGRSYLCLRPPPPMPCWASGKGAEAGNTPVASLTCNVQKTFQAFGIVVVARMLQRRLHQFRSLFCPL